MCYFGSFLQYLIANLYLFLFNQQFQALIVFALQGLELRVVASGRKNAASVPCPPPPARPPAPFRRSESLLTSFSKILLSPIQSSLMGFTGMHLTMNSKVLSCPLTTASTDTACEASADGYGCSEDDRIKIIAIFSEFKMEKF